MSWGPGATRNVRGGNDCEQNDKGSRQTGPEQWSTPDDLSGHRAHRAHDLRNEGLLGLVWLVAGPHTAPELSKRALEGWHVTRTRGIAGHGRHGRSPPTCLLGLPDREAAVARSSPEP